MSLTEFGHFSDPAFLILTSLANGAKHGYAMIEDIASFSSQRLGPGTLYGALARLKQRGWIEPLPAQQRRRPSRLTATGEAVLREHLSGLKRFTQVAGGRLGVSHE